MQTGGKLPHCEGDAVSTSWVMEVASVPEPGTIEVCGLGSANDGEDDAKATDEQGSAGFFHRSPPLGGREGDPEVSQRTGGNRHRDYEPGSEEVGATDSFRLVHRVVDDRLSK